MLDLVRLHHIEVFDHGLRPPGKGGYAADAIVDDATITVLTKARYTLDRHEDVDASGREAQSQVGRGNRYTDPPTDTTSG